MSVRHQHLLDALDECENCGATECSLLLCSRCRNARFCSVRCFKSYWPMHVDNCKQHEIADTIEASEPVFAAWMRNHGRRMAQLNDDHVERLERATKAACGPTHAEVLQSMYNRLDPTPRGPSYTPEERAAMHRASMQHQQTLAMQEANPFEAILPSALGKDCGQYKFDQDQHVVHVYLRLPEDVHRGMRVAVHIDRQGIEVVACAQEGMLSNKRIMDTTPTTILTTLSTSTPLTTSSTVVLAGRLYAPVLVEESTWQREGNIIELTLYKVYTRGRYPPNGTLADTFWWSLFEGAGEEARIAEPYPPAVYYSATHCVHMGNAGHVRQLQ